MLYFNIENGECVPAFTCLPSHRARITGSQIHSIETCFNVSLISQNSYEWFLEQVECDYLSWSKEHQHLMKSLKKLVFKMSLRHPFKYSNFEPVNHRFPFILVWSKDKKYTIAHFVQK
ncbi:hypothetical protein U9K47_15485 [Bacillus toyonensis]|uniref:hypothetical protein n=1 Tax=Bacillus toyonensis TaxID=155322 RepID=UPI0034679C9B